jgi:hypothetical protein
MLIRPFPLFTCGCIRASLHLQMPQRVDLNESRRGQYSELHQARVHVTKVFDYG